MVILSHTYGCHFHPWGDTSNPPGVPKAVWISIAITTALLIVLVVFIFLTRNKCKNAGLEVNKEVRIHWIYSAPDLLLYPVNLPHPPPRHPLRIHNYHSSTFDLLAGLKFSQLYCSQREFSSFVSSFSSDKLYTRTTYSWRFYYHSLIHYH